MFGSIYIGLSGLNAYSRGLQQVSNNVTNLNAQGFKASSVTFSDLFGAQGHGGLSYSSGEGQSGYGVESGATQTDFSQGELRQTDRDLDLSIDGSGFMMLMRGEDVAYTRTGSFEVDKDGFIVLSGTDYRLATLDASGHPVSLSIDNARTSPPHATTTVTFADNLSSSATSFAVSDVKVIDANGGSHVWQVNFAKDTTAADQWTVTVTDATGATIGTQPLHFVNGAVDPSAARLTFTDSTSGLSVGFDMSGVTSYSAGDTSTLQASAVDGYGLGTTTSVTINADGQLEIGYSNSQKKNVGAVAVADFRDPQALKQQSGGLFTDSGSAQRTLLTSADPRVGKVVSRSLEASNVDLSKEFGDLILIQRGFQASSQIVSVTNDMIQQLFGIRGQG